MKDNHFHKVWNLNRPESSDEKKNEAEAWREEKMSVRAFLQKLGPLNDGRESASETSSLEKFSNWKTSKFLLVGRASRANRFNMARLVFPKT